MPKNIQKLLTFHNDMWEEIQKYREEKGFLTDGEAIRALLSVALHKPEYAKVEERRKSKEKLTPLEKANAEIEAKEAKEQARKDKQLNLCTLLQGTVNPENGFCYYPRFELSPIPNTPVEKEVINTPLMDLHPIDLEEQYRDSSGKATDKDIVLKAIKKFGVKE